MSDKLKAIYIILFFLSAGTFIAIMPEIGLSSTLQGKLFYTSEYLNQLFTKASQETLTMFLWFEIFDLFLLIPTYTYMIYQTLKLVMYNFEISPFKVFAFAPAFFDVPETIILILNNAFYFKDPIFLNILPVLSCFKWALGFCLFVLTIIFLIAKLRGVTGMVKIMSYDDLWSNKKNVKLYWSWIGGHVFITVLSVISLISLMLMGKTPGVSLKCLGISVGVALFYDFIFNKFQPIPEEIFNLKYNHWLRSVFISFDSVFLMLVLSIFFV